MRIASLGALAFVFAAASPAALAKLPAPSDEAKAKAAEAAAKSAWSGKVDAYKLCLSMERVAGVYQTSLKQGGKEAKAPAPTPACTDPGPFVATPPAAPAGPVAAAAPAAPPAPAPAAPK
jgi:hypothetical protein